MTFNLKTLFCLQDQYEVGSDRTSALCKMRSFITKVHVQGKKKDSLALDRDKVTSTASSLCSRWQEIKAKAENLFNLRKQL